MADSKERLGTAPIGKLMLELAIPTVFAQMVNLLYNMVDRIYVGRIPETGAMALAGLGVTFPVTMLISAFAALIGMGGAPRASICMGQGNDQGAERILGSSVAFLVSMGLALSVFFMIAKRPILMMFGASETTIPYAVQYLGIYLIGTIPVQISLGLNQFITCQGFAKTGMMTVLIGAVLNIILDPILIYGFGMGVRGAALATIISQTVSAAWVIKFLSSSRSTLRIRGRYLKIDWNILKPVLLLGISPFIMQSTECLVQLTFNSGMQKYGNDYYVGAMTILFSMMQMVSLPVQGITQGAVPIISYNFGAGNRERVKQTFKRLVTCTALFNFCIAGFFVVCPGVMIRLFTSDPQIIDIASFSARIYFFGFMFFGAQSACQQTFLALGEAKISICLALLRKVVLLVPLALILPLFGLGTTGLLLAEAISDIISVSTAVTVFRFNFNRLLDRKPKAVGE